MEIYANYFESFEAFLSQCDNSEKEYFLLVAKQTKVDIPSIAQAASTISGAYFPEVIFNNKVYAKGLLAFEILPHMRLFFEKEIAYIDFEKMKLKEVPTVLTFVDGICAYNEEYLKELFKYVGLETNILGAGAGSLDSSDTEVFFDAQGFYHNCAVIILIQNRVDLGVKHGWEFLNGPFVVTKSEKNVVQEIDYKNAYEVYKKVVEEDSGIELTDENFFEISQHYPLGIIKYQGEQLVRDIIEVNDKELTLVGNLTKNSVVNILKGQKESLLDATMEASKDALKNGCKFIFMFDCFTRKNFLEDKFEEELDIIFQQNKSLNVVGAISIGEIANNGKHYINFFNKTCVIGGICF